MNEVGVSFIDKFNGPESSKKDLMYCNAILFTACCCQKHFDRIFLYLHFTSIAVIIFFKVCFAVFFVLI